MCFLIPEIGSWVSFISKRTGALFKGIVYSYREDSAAFGIDSVTRTDVSGSSERVGGCFQFSLNDIEDLKVIPAVPKSTTGKILLTPDYIRRCLRLLDEPQGFAPLPPPMIQPRHIEALETFRRLHIPDDLTFEILVKVPKRRYPEFSCVSKDFMRLLSSHDQIHQARRKLDRDAIYFCFDTGTGKKWFSLRRNKDDTTKDVFVEGLVLPPDHEWYQSSGDLFAVGPEILFVGKNSSNVWIFDTVSSVLSEAPTMHELLVLRTAAVIGNDLYVYGTKADAPNSIDRYMAQREIFDVKSRTWSAPTLTTMMTCRTTVTIDSNIYLIRGTAFPHCYYTKDGDGASYDMPYEISDRTWSTNTVCVMENILYFYDTSRGLHWYDTSIRKWKEVSGATLYNLRDNQRSWIRYVNRIVALKEYYGHLVLLWTDGYDFFKTSPGDTKNVWYTFITLKRDGREIHGEVGPFTSLGSLPSAYKLTHCVSVSR